MGTLQLENKSQSYEEIRRSLKGLLDGPMLHESALVSLIALLKEHLPHVSWVGFYRNVDGHLWIGPYQGRLACVHIRPGQGVCGAAAKRREPVVVQDVHAFEGHIACDPKAASEIVLPVFANGALLGVLDLDSHEPGAFDAYDQQALTGLLNSIEPLATRPHNS